MAAKPVEYVPRPDRLGLGARLDDLVLPAPGKSSAKIAQLARKKGGKDALKAMRGQVRADGTFIGMKRSDNEAMNAQAGDQCML